MKKYIGTKLVQATPAIRKGGKVYLPTDAIPRTMEVAEEGYKVVYEDGYESWSPKDVFEKAYQVAETHVDRMLIERKDLSEKFEKCLSFTSSDEFREIVKDDNQAFLLVLQRELMGRYLEVLNHRLFASNSDTPNLNDMSFGMAIEALKFGLPIRRKGWNGKGLMVFKQVPAHIESDIVPKMQSLPQSAKDLILKGKGFIDYTSQCLIYNESTGRADSWVPSISDVFAEDWEIVQ